VRNLRDPQDEVNARRSQVSWLVKATGDGWFVDQGSMQDIKTFENDSRDPKGVYEVKKSGKDPRRIPPPNVPQGLFQLIADAVTEIRMISNVNPEMRGEESQAISGVAMKHRKIEGETVNYEIYDNFKLTKRLLWKKLAKRIQEVYSDERIVRLTDPDSGGYQFIPINQRVPVDAQGKEVPPPGLRYKVLNDLGSFKYDLVMTEIPASPSHRQTALAILLDLLQKLPAIAPLVVDVIVEMVEGLPDKEKIVARIKQFVAGQMGPKKAPPPKVSVALKGEDLPQEVKAELARRAANEPDPREEQNPLGAGAGNASNPSGQLKTGGTKLNEIPDLAPPPTTGGQGPND